MWSIYDTMILVTGIIVAVIAIVPVANVKAAARLWAAVIGGGLIVAALTLGNLRSFRYPSFVFIGPVVALLALGVVVAEARKRGAPGDRLQFDDAAHGDAREPEPYREQPQPAQPEAVGSSALAKPVDRPPDGEPQGAPDESAASADLTREAAWRELHDHTTSASRLSELVSAHPEFGTAAAAHPNCYVELREWIAEYAPVNQ